VQNGMFALAPKADIDRRLGNVRFVPIADIRSVLTYRSDFSDKVFYKRIPYWPVFSCIILPRCKKVFAPPFDSSVESMFA
jgi:hypothetical protein